MSDPIKKVLVFCLSGLGDTILASPALAALSSMPQRFRLTLLTMFPSVKEYLVDQQFTKDVRYFDFLKNSKPSILAYLWQLRREKFDVSIIPYAMNRLEYNMTSYFVGAKYRIGFRYQRQSWHNLPGLNQCVIEENPNFHTVEENLRWASILSGQEAHSLSDELRYAIPPETIDSSHQFLKSHGLDQTPCLIGFHAGCNSLKNQQRRCWPAPRFAELINRLTEALPSARFILFEGPQDEAITREIQKHAKGIVLAKSLPMRVVGALIRRCKLFVSNDSGLMHVAAACKIPCVVIFGPTNPAWVRPWKCPSILVSRHLPCSPCFYYSSRPLSCPAGLDYACVNELPVEDVKAAVLQLLKV